MAENGSENESKVGLWGFAAQHVTFLATLASFLLVFLKVAFVAHGDPVVGAGIVAAAGPVSVLMGVLITATPIFVAGLFWALFLYVDRLRGWDDNIALGAYTVAGILTSFLMPFRAWVVLVLVPLFMFAISVGRKRWRRVRRVEHSEEAASSQRDSSREPRGRAWWISALVTMLVSVSSTAVLFNPRMWLPPEIVTTTDQPLFVGYVLATDGEWITVLTEEERRLIRVKAEEIETREVCELPYRELLGFLFAGGSNLRSDKDDEPVRCPGAN